MKQHTFKKHDYAKPVKRKMKQIESFDTRPPEFRGSAMSLLPPNSIIPADLEDYWEELVATLSTARELAEKSLQSSQIKSKQWYDPREATPKSFRVGEWVLVRFQHVEARKNRKLSQPWHGPCRILSLDEPDVTVQKVHRAKGPAHPSAPEPSDYLPQ